MSRMNPEVKALWLAALRSGDYKQTTGALCRQTTETGERAYCCLGVLSAIKPDIKAEVCVYDADLVLENRLVALDDCTSTLPLSVMDWAGLPSDNPIVAGRCLSNWNDHEYADFARIADIIETHL